MKIFVVTAQHVRRATFGSLQDIEVRRDRGAARDMAASESRFGTLAAKTARNRIALHRSARSVFEVSDSGGP